MAVGRHYKRHHELVTQLRSIYESCGEVDWTIVPVEPGDPRRGRSSNSPPATGEPSNRSLTPEETPTSKRERKDAKCLARAASRAKVVTQEEIRYLDSVLHSVDGVSTGDDAGPANPEEMQLIEEHLRYNANVYNSHSSRKELRKLAKIPDVDVDFDAEMDRVLDTFRITELVKRNLKNRGLQGKELKTFETLVEAFKNAVVEDLVLVKKDMMEIRMRRAGYLRYTNKTAYGIVEERYTEKDWKTGERISYSSSESSGFTSPSEDLITPQRYRVSPYDMQHSDTDPWNSDIPDTSLLPVRPHTQGPDRRHLQHTHTRVNGDDGLGQKIIEPYHTPLLPLTPNTTPKRPAVSQLKLIENKENRIPAAKTNRGSLRRDVAQQAPPSPPSPTPMAEPPSLFLPTSAAPTTLKVSRPLARPAWNQVAASSPPATLPTTAAEELSCLNKEMASLMASQSKMATEHNIKALSYIGREVKAPAVQAPSDGTTAGLRGPERALMSNDQAEDGHPIVSQKKTKKAQREAKRKAKKVSQPEETSSPTADENSGNEESPASCDETFLSDAITVAASTATDEMPLHTSISPVRELIDDTQDDAVSTDTVVLAEQAVAPAAPALASPTALPYTTHSRHDHWIRFTRVFLVDQLTVPLLQSFEGCTHGSSCRFEGQEVPDCPFHEPRKSSLTFEICAC